MPVLKGHEICDLVQKKVSDSCFCNGVSDSEEGILHSSICFNTSDYFKWSILPACSVATAGVFLCGCLSFMA